jgi:putative SOS response-associated peptidase YedK
MCSRYSLTSPPEAVRAYFRYENEAAFPPRYNIAPSQPAAIVRTTPTGGRELALVRWGLIPSWVKDPKAFSLLINARGESVIDKPAFRAAMRRRRCLVPADGFYEWKRDGERKRPYYIRLRSGQPMAFAGVWETWTGPNGEEMETAAIVTTQANRTLAAIHDRMPVILPPAAFDLWLDTANVDAKTAAAMLMPASDASIEAYEISTAVNRTANDNPSLIAPVGAAQSPESKQATTPKQSARAKRRADKDQSTLF